MSHASQSGSVDLMRLRGGLGIAGQALMITSGIHRGEKLKVWSAGTSIAANAINLLYGAQKKEDDVRLEEAREGISGLLGVPIAQHSDSHKADGMLQKADTLMQEHSVRISDGMKLGAKYMFRLAGLEANNRANTWHGNLSMAAKLVTLAGKDEDPYIPAAQKSTLAWTREKSNLISGGMELAAQYYLFPGAIDRLNKRTGQVETDWLQLGGASLFVAALVAKSFSPFTLSHINQEQLYAYAVEGLNALPEPKQRQMLPSVSRYMHEVLQKEAHIRKLPEADVPSREDIAQRLEASLHLPPQISVEAVRHQGLVATPQRIKQ